MTMIDVGTADSRTLTIDYRVAASPGSDASQPLTFGIYRSADAAFSSDDVAVQDAALIRVAVDDSGGPAASEGAHRISLRLPVGLPIDTTHPYVLAVANPQGSTATTDPTQAASFRKYTIGVVTHGGYQNKSWKNGPPWALQIGTLMKQQGYDAVIPYNWVRESSTPGAAVKQGPRLANLILRAAEGFASSDPVDLHLVAHSEGAVVNMIALNRIEAEGTPQIDAGYVELTLLDPHAASNAVPGRDFSSSGGLLGGIANLSIKNYQGRANDPQVAIPPTADDVQVFYQHTTASAADTVYNLWGQVPVAKAGAETHYYNLGAMNVTHSGKKGVANWYLNVIAPPLGQPTSLLDPLKLDGTLATPTATTTTAPKPDRTILGNQATFIGTATPDALVRLYLGPTADPSTIALEAQTTADPTGHWSLTTKPLPPGRYRAVAMSYASQLRTRPSLAIVPMAILGRFRVEAKA
ncbi:hypothetical protein EP7_002843 [Isosphaeraceae bacterium EP7]